MSVPSPGCRELVSYCYLFIYCAISAISDLLTFTYFKNHLLFNIQNSTEAPDVCWKDVRWFDIFYVKI